MTVEEYLAYEETAEEKHDYVDGKLIDVRAMAGGTSEHSMIELNWAAALLRKLEGKPCRPFSSNLKVRARKKVRYRYPDLSVACQPFEYDDRESSHRTLLNPTLIVEILSSSTESQDRGKKFSEYREIESFREYVLTAQHKPYVEVYFRLDDGQWMVNFTEGMDGIVRLRSLDIELPVKDLYVGVQFPVVPDEEPKKE